MRLCYPHYLVEEMSFKDHFNKFFIRVHFSDISALRKILFQNITSFSTKESTLTFIQLENLFYSSYLGILHIY